MTDDDDSRLYLFARLPVAIRDHVAASNDLDAARTGRTVVEDGRLHVTLLALDLADVAQDYMIALIGWILSTIPPFAFHVAFDELIVSARSALLKASDPLAGVIACQAHIAEMLANYGVELPASALPRAHVTLGYGYCEPLGAHGIDGISWLVEELVLVRSLHGRHRHIVLGEWRLPLRPGERDRIAIPA
jgi:2'-5' RNA ligase